VPDVSEQFLHLLQVQNHDTLVDQLVHRRATLGKRAELAAVENRLASLEARRKEVGAVRDDLGARQASLEEHINSSRVRSKELERRMFGGQVTAPRELQVMDEEVRHLARHVSGLEDRELEVMEELEPLDAELAEIDAQIDQLRSGAGELRSSISEQEVGIDAELQHERSERAAAAANVPADLLSRYEQLRKKLGGTGAARLVGGSCGGCHLQLPAMELDRVHKAPPDAVIYCDQCGRILVR
jgi:uncharacterized protein